MGRRLVILVAVLMGLMVLAASVAPPPPTPREAARNGGAAASPQAAAPATPEPVAPQSDATQPPATLDVARGRDHVSVPKGTALTLNVVADATGAVEIVGMSSVEAIDPSSPARFQLSADVVGHFPVRLVDGGKPLGELIVTPAS